MVERKRLENELKGIAPVKKIYLSDANFILTKVANAKGIYDYLIAKGIVVRDRSKVTLCEDCLRITVGTERENQILIEALKQYK